MRLSGLTYLLVMLLLTISACSKENAAQDGQKQERAIPVDLSFALEQSAGTKASVTTILELQNAGYFRGMESIRLIPFTTSGPVGLDDQSIGFGRALPSIQGSWDRAAYTGAASYHSGLIYNNHAHLYSSSYASMPERTSAVLVYGKGPQPSGDLTAEDKQLYGSLIATGLSPRNDFLKAEDISFSPDPIFTGPVPDQATDIVELLNAITEADTYTQTYYYKRNDEWHEASIAVSWNENLEEPLLRSYFEWFTNGGEMMSGAGGCVQTMLSNLYTRLSLYYSTDDRPYKQLAGGLEYPVYLAPNTSEPLTYSMLYDGLRDHILGRFASQQTAGVISIENLTVELDSQMAAYPASLGLPSGCAVIRWNGLHFVVVTEGLDGIAAMDRFCYMPPLGYFANTTISTSADPEIYKNYTENSLTWTSILSNYRQGKVVRRGTCAVALDEPLRFADALLAVTLRSSAATIPDRDRQMVATGGQSFPVTGIIVGGQYGQHFNFTPDKSSGEYYLYDNKVSGIYLTPTKSSDTRTLVLPTPDGEDIYFCLELRNDSAVTFRGAEGLIYPGNYFYLIGKLAYEEGKDQHGQATSDFPAVFVQDYLTRVDCTVSSLEYAHISIPDLHNPQLVLGVQTDINWIMSTGTYVVLN